MSHPIGEYFNIVRQVASQNSNNQSSSVNYTPVTNYTPGPVDANRVIKERVVSSSPITSLINQISSSSHSSPGPPSNSSHSLSSSSSSHGSPSSSPSSLSSPSSSLGSSSVEYGSSGSSSDLYSSSSSGSSSRASSSSLSPGSSSASHSSSSQYSFSSKELQGNKEFWNIYNTYAIRAVDEKIKNDPEFRKALAEAGDYAFARSQTILLTAIHKYKTGKDGVILAPKEKRGSYLSDSEIAALIDKENKEKQSSIDNTTNSDLVKKRPSAFAKVKELADSALAARSAFSQIAVPIASNVDGSVTYLLGNQTVKVKDVKIEYAGIQDGKHLYKQTLRADSGKQYSIEVKLGDNLERAEYTIKEHTIKENRPMISSNAFVPYPQELNYTPYNPVLNNYERRKEELSPPEKFERAAKEGFKRIGVSNIPVIGDIFNFSTEIFSRGVVGSAFELVNPSGAVGEKAKSIGQSGIGFAASLPFRAAAGAANLLIINPLEAFKEYGKSGVDKIKKRDYLGGAFDIGLGAVVAGLTVVPFTRGAVNALKGAGPNLIKKESFVSDKAIRAEAKAIEKLNQKVYGSDYVYIKTGSIENNAIKNVVSSEVKQKKSGIFDKIDIPGSIGLSAVTDPVVTGAAFNAMKSMFPAFVPAVAVRSVKYIDSPFIGNTVKTVSVPKYRFVSPGLFSEKESSFENNFFVVKPYKEKGITIGGINNSKSGLLVVKERKNINELSLIENKNILRIKDSFGKESVEPWPFEIISKTKNENKNKNKIENEYPWGANYKNILITKEKNKNKSEEEIRFKLDEKYKIKIREGSIFGRKGFYKEDDLFGLKEKYSNKERYKNKTKNQFEDEYMYGRMEQYVRGTKAKNKSKAGKVRVPIPNISLPSLNFLERPGRKRSFALGFSELAFIK